jgi:uroporphyrinogen-III decarboxylase
MSKETMTSKERVLTAIKLEKPDRVPMCPSLTNHGAGHLSGRSQAAVHSDPDVAMDAYLEVFDTFGGWDMFEYPVPCMPVRWGYRAGLTAKLPGRDLPDNFVPQPHEQENVKFEDYETIIDNGWYPFAEEDLIHRVSGLTPDELEETDKAMEAVTERSIKEFAERNVFTGMMAEDYHPFFKLSLSRSMVTFSEDLYYHPDMVEKAIDRMTDETIEVVLANAKKYNQGIIGITEERAGAYFYPLPIFERFWWPYTQRMVEAFWDEGLVSHFHIDLDWTQNFPYFRNLPKGSAILSLDGTCDIFNAKKVIGDHLCLKGDVHPSMLSVQEPKDVEAYVKRLIDEVGGNGGFILGVGCEVPATCKPENLRALLETGRHYELGG